MCAKSYTMLSFPLCLAQSWFIFRKARSSCNHLKKTGIEPHFNIFWEVGCLRAGWVPMRKEIVWNVGMHSHPNFLNKLPMNEAVNAGEQKTTITHPPTQTSATLRENETKMCSGTQLLLSTRAAHHFCTHTLTPRWCFDERGFLNCPVLF